MNGNKTDLDPLSVLVNFKGHILVVGYTGSGKTQLLKDASIPDSKYYHFPEMNMRHVNLSEENFSDFDFLDNDEKTLIFDAVDFPVELVDSKIAHFLRTVRKYSKRVIAVTYLSEIERLKPFFGAVIILNRNGNGERTCEVKLG